MKVYLDANATFNVHESTYVRFGAYYCGSMECWGSYEQAYVFDNMYEARVMEEKIRGFLRASPHRWNFWVRSVRADRMIKGHYEKSVYHENILGYNML